MVSMGRRFREAKGVRAFGFEVLVVVVGVLIALGAQEMVTDWSWQNKVAKGEQELRIEQQGNYLYSAEYSTVAPCIDAQIDKIRLHLLDDTKRSTPVPLALGSVMGGVIVSPYRPRSDGAWQALLSDGTVSHLPSQRQQAATVLYTLQDMFAVRQDQIRDAITEMRVLAESVRLDDGNRVALLQKLAAMRAKAADNQVFARQTMAITGELGNAPSHEEIAQFLDSGLSRSVQYCRENGLPLGDWQDELKKGVTETRPQ